MTLPAESMPVPAARKAARKDYTRNRTGWSRLSPVIGMNGRVPIHLAGLELQDFQPATGLLQRIVSALRPPVGLSGGAGTLSASRIALRNFWESR